MSSCPGGTPDPPEGIERPHLARRNRSHPGIGGLLQRIQRGDRGGNSRYGSGRWDRRCPRLLPLFPAGQHPRAAHRGRQLPRKSPDRPLQQRQRSLPAGPRQPERTCHLPAAVRAAAGPGGATGPDREPASRTRHPSGLHGPPHRDRAPHRAPQAAPRGLADPEAGRGPWWQQRNPCTTPPATGRGDPPLVAHRRTAPVQTLGAR